MQERGIIEYSLRLSRRDIHWDIQRIKSDMM